MPFEAFPQTRLRRLRTDNQLRDMIAESVLLKTHLVLPLFVCQDAHVASVTGDERLQSPDVFLPVTLRDLPRFVEEKVLPLGVGSIALFPIVETAFKDQSGTHALSQNNILLEAVRCLRARYAELVLISDVALDPYTTHGHDGVVVGGDVANDETIEKLSKMAVLHADAGVDIVGLSDMMDGRVRCVRKTLDESGFQKTKILSYVAKYASHLYAPFRKAIKAGGEQKASICKKTYQMDVRNSREALREASLDIEEGADLLMVKPAGYYLDILSSIRQHTHHPLCVFQVSGEYAMLKAASDKGLLSHTDILLETLMCFRRAGASIIFTYGALEAAACIS